MLQPTKLHFFSRSSVKFQGHKGRKIDVFDPNWVFLACNSILTSQMATKWGTMLKEAQKRCPIVSQGYLSNFKVTGAGKSTILIPIEHFRTVTRVWMHRWLRNNAQSLKWHRRGALLFFEVICQISRSHRPDKSTILTRIDRFMTITPVWIHRWLLNDAQSLKWYRRCDLLFFEVIHQISRSQGSKNRWFGTNFSVSGWQLQFQFMDGYETTHVA